MENIAYAQQIAEINRVAVDTTWNVVNLIQNQTERTVRALIDQGNEMAEQGQRALQEWTDEYKRSRQAIQDVLEENRVSLEQLFTPPKPAKAAKPATRTKKTK
jgi:phage-related minor tail protein